VVDSGEQPPLISSGIQPIPTAQGNYYSLPTLQLGGNMVVNRSAGITIGFVTATIALARAGESHDAPQRPSELPEWHMLGANLAPGAWSDAAPATNVVIECHNVSRVAANASAPMVRLLGGGGVARWGEGGRAATASARAALLRRRGSVDYFDWLDADVSANGTLDVVAQALGAVLGRRTGAANNSVVMTDIAVAASRPGQLDTAVLVDVQMSPTLLPPLSAGPSEWSVSYSTHGSSAGCSPCHSPTRRDLRYARLLQSPTTRLAHLDFCSNNRLPLGFAS